MSLVDGSSLTALKATCSSMHDSMQPGLLCPIALAEYLVRRLPPENSVGNEQSQALAVECMHTVVLAGADLVRTLRESAKQHHSAASRSATAAAASRTENDDGDDSESS